MRCDVTRESAAGRAVKGVPGRGGVRRASGHETSRGARDPDAATGARGPWPRPFPLHGPRPAAFARTPRESALWPRAPGASTTAVARVHGARGSRAGRLRAMLRACCPWSMATMATPANKWQHGPAVGRRPLLHGGLWPVRAPHRARGPACCALRRTLPSATGLRRAPAPPEAAWQEARSVRLGYVPQ